MILMGRTGDGKSTLGNSLAEHLGVKRAPFATSDAAVSHTQATASILAQGVNINDSPGLMDTMGKDEDAAKIRAIVAYLMFLGYINALILVINEQAPRCDSSLQDAIKLLLDCFGNRVVGHIGLAFTRSIGLKTAEASRAWVRECCRLLSERTGYQVPEFPSWQLDLKPEAMALLGVPAERIEESKQRTNQALFDMLQWARTKPEMPTADMVAADYDHVRELKEEKKAREHDNTVVSEVEEKRTRTLTTISTPIMGTESQRVRTAPVRLGKLGTSKLSSAVQVGTKVTTHKAEEKRKVQTLGNGRVIYGEWLQVRDWDE